MGRSPCREKVGLKKGPWTPEEDQKLMAYIEEHGDGSWRSLPAKAGLQRCGKSCRLRWTNYLRPDIKRGKFTPQEEQTIIQLHALVGNRWSVIAGHLPMRTDNEIKNYWNTNLKKRLIKMGIDPVTHKPKTEALQSKDAANLISHIAQWESARLEAEARLVRGSKLAASTANPYQPPHQLGSSAPAPAEMPPCLDVLKAWQGAWINGTKSNPAKADARHGGVLLNSFCSSSNGTLESPTFGFNFSDSIIPHVGFVDSSSSSSSSLGAMNFVENNQDKSFKILQHQQEQIHEMPYPYIDPTNNYIAETLRLPSFMECYNDVGYDNNVTFLTNFSGQSENADGGCGVDFGENKISYWNNSLNEMTMPTLQSASPS